VVVWVTGGTRGLGRDITLLLVQSGAKVYVSARSHVLIPREATFVQCDVTDVTSVEEAARSIVQVEGRIDVVIANAGLNNEGLFFSQQSRRNMEGVVLTNCLGVSACFHAALPHMRRQGRGVLAAVSSLAGDLPLPGASQYGASKSFIDALVQGLHAELLLDRDSGIVPVSLKPGFIDTAALQAVRQAQSEAGDVPHPVPFLMSSKRAAVKCVEIIEQALRKSKALQSSKTRLGRALAVLQGPSLLCRFPWQLGFVTRLSAFLPSTMLQMIIALFFDPPRSLYSITQEE